MKNLSPPDTMIKLRSGANENGQPVTYAQARQQIMQMIRDNHFIDAEAITRQLIAQLPRDPWPPMIAAEILLLLQQLEPALQAVDRALGLDPESPLCLALKSRICLNIGEPAQAGKWLDKAISFEPKNTRLHFEKGQLLTELGDLPAARAAFLNAIECNPRNTIALFGLSRLPGAGLPDELVKNTEFLLQSGQLSADDQIKAHFALANSYDKQSMPDEHFRHLHSGNQKKARTLKFDAEYFDNETREIIEFFSADFFARQAPAHENPARTIFIIGFPRCGSTLIEQILSSHPQVSAAGETFAFRHSLQDFQQALATTNKYPNWLQNLDAGQRSSIGERYLQKTSKTRNTLFMTDKLLDNYKFVGAIQLVLPDAIIINVSRDPVDVCYSCYKNLFHLSAVPYSYDLDNLAGIYRNYRALIRHWNAVLPGKIYNVAYEDLISDQEQITRQLLEHCGLDWNDACLNFHENQRSVMTNSSVQVRQKLYRDSVRRWTQVAEYLGPLTSLADE